jgi:iron complex outermembrane receptor protein
MARSGRTVLLLASLGLAAWARARAGEPPPASVQPEEVVVEVRRASSEAARRPGAAVTTVDAAQYEGEAKSTAELLATAPGVAVTEHGGPGQLSLVSIRGSSAEQVKVLLDGLQLNGAGGGGVDLSSIPARWISRIEVVRGTEGVHHGSGALGGVVNVVTLPVQPGTWGASATAASFDTYEGDVHYGTGGERWGLLTSLTGTGTGGTFPYVNTWASPPRAETRSHAAVLQGGALVKGFWLPGEGRLDAALQIAASRRDLPGSLQNATPEDWQEDARGLLAAKYRRALGDGPTLTVGSWLRLDRLEVSLAELPGGDPDLQRGLAGGGSVGLSWTGEGWAVSTSGELSDETLAADGNGDVSRLTLAAALSGEVALLGGRVRIGPGLRFERAGAFDGVSAKLGASADVGGPFSLRASFGRTYRIPSFAELYLEQGVVEPNPDLEPEVGLGGDAALVAQGRHGSLSVGGFAVVYENLVVYVMPSFGRFRPQNLGRSSARGIEVEGASVPLRHAANLAVGLAYTWLVTETLRGGPAELGKDLPQKPRHRLYARLSGGRGPVELHTEAQYLSQRYADLANTASIPEVLTFNAGGSVRLHRDRDVHLHLDVRNVLDDRTIEDGFLNPLPGRAILVTLRAGSTEGSR